MSRKFKYAQKETFEEISRYLSTLKGYISQNWAAFESVWAGTHVHIGLNVQANKEISQPKVMHFLQHLAYILISYEDLLTQLHPIHRSGDGPEYNAHRANSPTMRLVGETEEAQAERTAKAAVAAHRSHQELGSNAEHLATKAQRAGGAQMLTWLDMRDTLFQEKLKITEFVEMLQDSSTAEAGTHRGFFVNFANLSNSRFNDAKDKPIKPTIEFRQHACSLDAGEVQYWVDLLFTIVRVAKAKVMQTTKFNSRDLVDQSANFAERGSKYRINDQWHRSTIKEFCGSDLLDLDRVECEYWEGRHQMYRRDMRTPPWE
jgi:DNA-binding ferritin-like protein